MKVKFPVGTTVRLKAGGPDMSVKSVPSQLSSHYVCQWFAGKKLEQGTFAEETLETVPVAAQK